MRQMLARLATAAIGFLVATGFEVSGIESPVFAFLLWAVAALIALIMLATWPPVARWLPSVAVGWPALKSAITVRRKPAVISPTATHYPRGVIDFWRDGERAVHRFNQALVAIAETMQASNKKTPHFVARLEAEQKRVPPSAERIHEGMADLAQSLNRYTAKMAALHSEADDARREMSENYTDFLKWQTDKDALISFRRQIAILRDGARQGKEGMSQLRQTLLNLQGMNFAQSVNEACGQWMDTVTAIIATIEAVEGFTGEAFYIIDQKVGSRQVRRSTSRKAKPRPPTTS